VTSRRFAVTFDYRCPFARNAHEHVLDALEGGAPFEVEFVPFSLSAAHVEQAEGSPFDDPARRAEHLAMEAAVAVREQVPDRFLALHRRMFAARHDESRDLREEAVVADVLAAAGLDPATVLAWVAEAWPREILRKEHEQAATLHGVFGVPTFLVGDRAVFVRVMTRPRGDAALARTTVERVLDLAVDHPELNELKHTTIPR
jgi:2-hydroxychromene-2-carboxylate isomerase